jgi:hypothetical protein
LHVKFWLEKTPTLSKRWEELDMAEVDEVRTGMKKSAVDYYG